MLQGDALDLLPVVCAEAPAAAPLCLYHSFVVNQFPPGLRQHLMDVIENIARDFEHCFRISLEWLNPDEPPALRLAHYRRGTLQSDRLLAHCSAHLRWLRWL
jgi:hypothetical protein